MKKPERKDFPPESPHDLEWGGYNHAKYQIALAQWEAAQLRQTSSFFSRQDIGGEEPEKFRLHLQIANLKQKNSSLLEALKEINNLVGTVNFSSHTQMREALEGALELSENAIKNLTV